MPTTEESLRYQRHLTLPQVGPLGQQKLRASRVLCIGAGGLGSPLLLYLAAAGVGHIGIIDDDSVEISNLQRQILYNTHDVGQKKAGLAKAKLQALNPLVEFSSYEKRLTPENALALFAQYDIIADSSDNFATRYLVNDTCVQLQKPNVYASIYQFVGQCSIFTAQNGPCYRCLYETPPANIPNCTEGGVLGVLPGIVGAIQAAEVIKLIIEMGEPLIGRLLTLNALTMQFAEFGFSKNPHCTTCANPSPPSFITSYKDTCTMTASAPSSITAQELKALQQHNTKFILLDVREPEEYFEKNLGGVLIPLGELPHRLNELDKNAQIIVHCKAGPRSQRACQILVEAGFHSVAYLKGGILGYE